MDARSEMEPILTVYCAMFGAEAVARAVISIMEDAGKGDEVRQAFREHEEERKRGLADETGDPDAWRN